jgi:hypothetical protein
LIGKLFNPATWISIIVVVMGLAATLQTLSTSTAGTAVAQFFGGSSQGTFSATVPLYYTYWYTREELALRITLYVGISASLGAFSTWVAYLVTLIKSHLPPNKVSPHSSIG